jgi:BTB/POZ domain/Galactose oxidase, central domain/Kelch motif
MAAASSSSAAIQLDESFRDVHCWQRVLSGGGMPCARHVHTMITHGHIVYIFAGYTRRSSDYQPEYLNDLLAFNLRTAEWRTIVPNINPNFEPSSSSSSLSSPNWLKTIVGVHSHCSVVHDGKLYVHGGASKGGVTQSSLLCCDLARECWQELAVDHVEYDGTNDDVALLKPAARWGHDGAVWRHYMYVFGGYGARFFADLWRFDFVERRWQRLRPRGTPPQARQYHRVVVAGNRLYVYGGCTHGSTFYGGRVHRYCCLTDEWLDDVVVGGDRAPQLRGHVMVAHDGSLYIQGGRLKRGMSTEIYRFDTDTSVWSCVAVQPPRSAAEVPAPRYFHASALLDDDGASLLIFGGLAPTNTNDFYRLRLSSSSSSSSSSSGAPGGVRRSIGDDLASSLLAVAAADGAAAAVPPFADICFVVGEQRRKFHAHRALLWARSAHFRAMLASKSRNGGDNEPIELPHVDVDVFAVMLEWIYRGYLAKSRIDADKIVPLVIAADAFLLPELVDFCQRLLIAALSPDNVDSMLDLANHIVALQQLRVCCQQYQASSI